MTTTTTAPATATAAVGTPARTGLTSAGLITVLLGAALPIIDFFIVNVALPTIDADLHASTATLELVVAGYGIAYAVLLVLGGRLGDTFGRRKLFLLGLILFTLTSLACGVAPDAATLVIARVAQGAASAMLLPQVLSIIQAGTSGERRSRAIGLFGATGGIATVIGQLLGGALVAANLWDLSWRPIFLVNVPIGLIGLLLARRTVPDSRASNPLGVDRWGTALLAVSLLSLLIPIMEGRALGWPWWSIALLVLFPFAAYGFARVERKLEAAGGTPLLPPALLRTASVRHGLTVAVPFFCTFGSFMFVYAVTLQNGLHLGPLGAGLALTPMAVAYFTTSLVSSHLVTRFGRKIVPIGGLILAVGLLALAGTALLEWPDLSIWQLAPAMVLIGVGNGLAMSTLFRVVLSRVPADLAGVGGGVLTTTQQTSLALGVAVLGSLFASLSVPGVLGYQGAFVLVIGILAALALLVSGLARKLPDPR
ncbi:MFS transporter [Amycolatopsis echigonensis]|uniref:MFS transporter n=1 Tax=Amycolatopsis echigonensis TaxID=2576905 RepID=A0A2N3WG93_9PSEU|nr:MULTISPECIES: MFS transporter [Amycolatopsis]MBB2497951.1 MFS transporter [Amycolatopsis echigonensis]PKV92869.1 MFS transporter [Amycolatopsis niigatensis]